MSEELTFGKAIKRFQGFAPLDCLFRPCFAKFLPLMDWKGIYMTIQERFNVGQRVAFIVQNRLLFGSVAREHFDGQIVRVEISRETGCKPIWDIPREQVAPSNEGGAK